MLANKLSEKTNTALRKAIFTENVGFLVKYCFPTVKYDLTPKQLYVVRLIAFGKHRHICLSAMTRWGKTQAAAFGVALYILFHRDKRISFVGPKEKQAGLVKRYMIKLVYSCKQLRELADLEKGGEHLQKEATKSRLTFKNGCEYEVFTAGVDGSGLMGFGGNMVVLDESCYISRIAYAKIWRMLGDDPRFSIIIELFNPWERDCVTFENWEDPEILSIRVGWETALREGRTTVEYVERMRRKLTPLEFTVLIDSRFPDEGEDSLYPVSKINAMMKKKLTIVSDLEELEKKLERPQVYKEIAVARMENELGLYEKIISCDPADKGLDETVILWGARRENIHQVSGAFSEPKSESIRIINRICNMIRDFVGRLCRAKIAIDGIGWGQGVVSGVKDFIKKNNYKNVRVIDARFGARPNEARSKKKDEPLRFRNRKAEAYFDNRAFVVEELISTPVLPKLKSQMMAMKYEKGSTFKIEIVDPDKSPDWPDALVYFTWEDKKGLIFAFV